MSLVDVIVVNWNDRDNLSLALDSVFALPEVRTDSSFATIVVSDNGSTDGSVGALRERYAERISIIENGRNLGFGAGVNRALAQTRSPYVFVLNPDATLGSGALSQLVGFMQAHSRCALAGPKIFEADGQVAESCGEFDTWFGAFLRSSAWGEWPFFKRFANGAALRAWDYAGERRVDLVIGAAMMLRRSAIEEIGAFDERFFMYHEEVDLAKRLADAGYETWFVPSAVATHTGQGSSGGCGVESYKQRSRRKYWIKHHGRLWYYALSVALAGRYVLYGALAGGAALLARRLLLR